MEASAIIPVCTEYTSPIRMCGPEWGSGIGSMMTKAAARTFGSEFKVAVTRICTWRSTLGAVYVPLGSITPQSDDCSHALPSPFHTSHVTVPGPLALVHLYVSAPGGFGSPSSVADPPSVALRVGTV